MMQLTFLDVHLSNWGTEYLPNSPFRALTCTAELLSLRRRPSLRKTRVLKTCKAKLFYLFKILHFWCFTIFSSFSLTWGHMGEKNQTTSPLKLHNRFTRRKIMHTSREGLPQRCIKIGEISNFGFLPIFFVLVNTGPYGRKKVQATPCLKLHNRFAPKISGILLEMVSTKVV